MVALWLHLSTQDVAQKWLLTQRLGWCMICIVYTGILHTYKQLIEANLKQ